MKAPVKKQFTLIELMFVIGVLVILITITWIPGSKIIKKQNERKTIAEIKMLTTAVELYKIRYGSYPAAAAPTSLNFAEKLSDTKPGSGSSGKREMYVDFKKRGFKVSNENYSDTNATETIVMDPYENTYLYYYDTAAEKFYIWSVGHDGNDSSSDDFTGSGDGSFGDDITSENLLK